MKIIKSLFILKVFIALFLFFNPSLSKEINNLRSPSSNYILPKKNIALYPTNKRENSRLLVYNPKKITDSNFKNIDCL